MTAKDTDLNANISYSIIEPVRANTKTGIQISSVSSYDFKSAFRIDPSTGKIFVIGPLNYNEVATIIFPVRAQDLNAAIDVERQLDTTEVMIYIQPFKNTNPIFNNKGWSSQKPELEVDVDEEIALGTTFLKLDAEDPVSQSIITSFELAEPDPEGYITLNDRTGEVSVKKRLDYETLTNTTFSFTVKALTSSGKRFSTAKVNVTVKNINDNTPQFDQSAYKVTVLESVNYPDTLLTIKATDDDAARSEEDEKLGYNQITYSLAGTNAPLFMINNKTGVIQVAKGMTLDREQQSMIKLTGVAEDSFGKVAISAKTTVSILIELLDVNDNAPSFSQKMYTAVIPETSPTDSLVIKLDAKDPDEGPGGEIKFDILNEGELAGLLKIDSDSGEIRTTAELTGKGRSEPYEIVVRAQDNGGQVPNQRSLFNDVTLLLYIGDTSANDGTPYFLAPKVGQTAHISEVSHSVASYGFGYNLLLIFVITKIKIIIKIHKEGTESTTYRYSKHHQSIEHSSVISVLEIWITNFFFCLPCLPFQVPDCNV